ncbi:MAG: transcription antitermination factor NusB [Proteobacteria bacterium]|nr:transcription antitermination factor NusB [Pseudomonadota bacterium]
MNAVKPRARHKARQYVLQALYQWQMTQITLSEIEIQFHTYHGMKDVDFEYFHELIHQIPAQLDTLDETFKKYIDRKLEELNIIELMILRMGTYELMHRTDIPYKVIINEALVLAKSFGATEGHKYVNGVLDKVAREYRQIEFQNADS